MIESLIRLIFVSIFVERVTRGLIAADILEKPRSALISYNWFFAGVLTCFYCMSFWVSLFSTAIYWKYIFILTEQSLINWLLTWFSVHGIACYLYAKHDKELGPDFSDADKLFKT